MNPITLQPDGGLLYGRTRIDGDPLPFLGYQIELAEECSLRSFFRMLEKYPVLVQLNPFTPMFLDSFQELPPEGCRIDGVSQLELMRKVEMTGFPGDPGMNIFISFEGRSDGDYCDIKPFWLEHLLDLSLALGGLKHRVFGDKIDDFDFKTAFNLFELIDGICWQLSFHNLPETCRVEL